MKKPPIPASEDADWADLSSDEQAAAEQLGYTQETWDATPAAAADDEIRTPEGDIEEFWNSFAWEELTAAEQEAWGVLGWEATSWDEETTIPASEDADWADLSSDEQAAAEQLGYTQETWDATDE